MATTDEKLDRLTWLVEHLVDDVQELKTEMKEVKAEITGINSEIKGMKTEIADMKTDIKDIRQELQEFRAENAKEHELLRNQVGAVAKALNQTIEDNDMRHEELKAKDAELERVQNLHSTEILKLQAG